MRRGINIRKRKKILFNEANQKALKLTTLLTLILIICISIYFFFIKNFFIKQNLEKDSIDFSNFNENIPFSLNKIILFSSATAESGSVNNLLSLDISQYCDIGIYLNNLDKENTFIKSLSINNITISSPEIGTPYLYKKRVNDLGKASFNQDLIIENNFDFNIVENANSINYDNYELSNDGTTPISLGFFNKDIKKGFISEESEILYNGTLLKSALIPQTSLNCSISFSVNIETIDDKQYMCNVSFDIPFEDEKGLMYDTGYATKEFEINETSKFIRIK